MYWKNEYWISEGNNKKLIIYFLEQEKNKSPALLLYLKIRKEPENGFRERNFKSNSDYDQ